MLGLPAPYRTPGQVCLTDVPLALNISIPSRANSPLISRRYNYSYA
jgi:hypothetical protein